MTAAIQLDQPIADQTRTELTLTRIGDAWRSAVRGREFTEALVDFLRQHRNPHTLRSYSFSVLEFFGWFEKERGFIATPDHIRRGDAVSYEKWLRERRFGLRIEQLHADPSRRLDAAIYRFVEQHPGAGLREIAAAVGRAPDEALAHRLACLVRVKTLVRSPSIAQIRRREVDVGIPASAASRTGIDFPVPLGVFRYGVPQQEQSEAERASTVATRLSALSSLWDYLMQTGDNVGSGVPLLRVNVFKPLLRQAQRQAPTHQRASRQAKTPGLSLFERLLATTYARRFKGEALRMAASQMRPGQIEPPQPAPGRDTYSDLRDRAMMLVLGQTGVRAEELGRLQRRDVAGDPPVITVRGKGGNKRQIRLPSASHQSLRDLEAKLRKMAAHQARYHQSNRAAELLAPGAPLLPAVAHWGANAGAEPSRGLGRSGIAMMLRRRAVQAGIQPGTDEFARIHPHGLRHLFAKVAIESGTAVNVVQAVMGHQRGSTTLKYMEEHEPTALIAAGFAAPSRSPAGPERSAPQRVAPTPVARPQAPKLQPARSAPGSPESRERTGAPTPAPTPAPARPRPATPRRPPPPRPPPPPPPSSPMDKSRPLRKADGPPDRDDLVGYGESPQPPVEPEREIELDEVSMRLDRIYERQWGEKGHRERLKRPAAAERDIERASVGAELAAILGMDVGSVEPEAFERLTHAYVGTDSGLVWWAGPTGRLKPEMPVMSPSQAASCEPDSDQPVCQGLSRLWQRWASGAGRGPTAASAMLLWLAESLEVAAQVNAEVEARDGFWVPTDAAWEDTSEAELPRRIFREQDPEAVVAWFEAQAWQHRRSRTRQKKVIDTELDLPPYYTAADPIAELDDAERSELLDWIAALSDQMPRDQRARFGSSSRADLAKLIGQMCLYDQQLDVVRDARAQRRRGEGSELEIAAAEAAAARAGRNVDRLIGVYGGPPDYGFGERTSQRIQQRKGVTGEASRENRQAFYLRTLRDLFGDEAADDPALRLVALCGRAPLADPRFRDLLRINWFGRTIDHEPAYARAFAEETGTHSECVARRLARDLWELHKQHLAGSRQRVLTRPDELVDAVEAMQAYRVPCPRPLEAELQRRIGRRGVTPLYATWEAASGVAAAATPTHRQAAIEQELADLQQEYGEAVGADFVRGLFEPNPSRRISLPTPADLLAAVLVR